MNNIKEYIERVQVQYAEKNKEFNNYKVEIEDYLNNVFISKINLNNISLSSRIKSKESLGEKIIRKDDYIKYKENVDELIKNLKDPIGIRMTCLLDSHEVLLYDELTNVFNEQIEIDEKIFFVIDKNQDKNYLAIAHQKQPEKQKNGKKIFRMECKWVSNSAEINVELQLKSLVHMFWGEIEHEIMYKNYHFNKDQDFFSKILNNMSDLLHLVDGELESIQKHINLQKEIDGNLRKTDYFTQEMNLYIQPKIDQILGVSIDLRNVYKLITKINNYDVEVFLDLFKSALVKEIENIKIDLIDFENINSLLIYDPDSNDSFCNEINLHVSQKMMEGNIYWNIAFVIFYKITNCTKEEAYAKFIDLLYKPFSDLISLSPEDISFDEQSSENLEKYTSLSETLNESDEIERTFLISSIIEESVENVLEYLLNKNKQFELFLQTDTKELFADILELKYLFAFSAENLDYVQLKKDPDTIIEYVKSYFQLYVQLKYYYNDHHDLYEKFKELLENEGAWLIPLTDKKSIRIFTLLKEETITYEQREEIAKILTKREHLIDNEND